MLAVAPEKFEPYRSSDVSLPRHAVRFKAWSVMVAVAVVAICCSVATHVESAVSNAIAIILACAACLTCNPVCIIIGGGVGAILALPVASWLRSTVWPLASAARGGSLNADSGAASNDHCLGALADADRVRPT
jgi:hypothetical protein